MLLFLFSKLFFSKFTLYILLFCSGLFLPDFLRGFHQYNLKKELDEKFRIKFNALQSKLEDGSLERWNCNPEKFKLNLIQLAKSRFAICFCKPMSFFRKGCVAKVEIFSRKPFIVKIHGYFTSNKTDLLRKKANEILKNIPTNPDHQDLTLQSDYHISNEVFDALSKTINPINPIGIKPEVFIIPYSDHSPIELNHDGLASRFKPEKFSLQTVVKSIKSTFKIFQQCYILHNNINSAKMWKCLFFAIKSQLLESPPYWNNFLYGSQVATVFIQLSENLEGGEIYFPLINLTIETRKSDILIWGNFNDEKLSDLNLEPKSINGRCPVFVGKNLELFTFIGGKYNTFKEIGQKMARPIEK